MLWIPTGICNVLQFREIFNLLGQLTYHATNLGVSNMTEV